MNFLTYKNKFVNELSELYSESESAELFSIFLLKKLNINSIEQRRMLQEELTDFQFNTLQDALNSLKSGKPYQQILGEAELYGFTFFVDENVLIPRPETEELLELAIGKIKEERRKRKEKEVVENHFKILDIGTGSGIIPIVLKKNFPEAEVSAIDFSQEALKVAKHNAENLQVEIQFLWKDYLNENLQEKYEVIISNPPYIGIDERQDIADSVKSFEPEMALFSPTENALIFYEKIAKDCENHLAENGFVFLEINQKLGDETRNLFQDVLSEVFLLKDISGNDRFVFGRK